MMRSADLRHEKPSRVLNRIAETKDKQLITVGRASNMPAGILFVDPIEQAGSAGGMNGLPLRMLPLAQWSSESYESGRRFSLEVRQGTSAMIGPGFDDPLTRW